MRCTGCPQKTLSGQAEVFSEYCEKPVELMEGRIRKLGCPAVLSVAVKTASAHGFTEVRQEILQEYMDGTEADVVVDLRDTESTFLGEAGLEDQVQLGWRADEAIRHAAQIGLAEVYQHPA